MSIGALNPFLTTEGATMLGVDHKTVGSERKALVHGGEIPHQPTIGLIGFFAKTMGWMT